MNECKHSYVIPRGNFNFCLQCKQLVEIKEEGNSKELAMPPRIYEITERLWEEIKPWPLLPFKLVEQNMWYISIINGGEYLVMPILKTGNPIYFSARRFSKKDCYPKYLYPEGVKTSYFTKLSAEDGLVIMCEGVADAVYCSQIGGSVALLGNYYNGSLDGDLAGKHVAICLDGDAIGILSAMRISTQIKNAKSVKVVVLPNGKDPTDIEVEELRNLIMK